MRHRISVRRSFDRTRQTTMKGVRKRAELQDRIKREAK